MGYLQTALDDGINQFMKFGGGIGQDEGPADMRPDLEGIKKSPSCQNEAQLPGGYQSGVRIFLIWLTLVEKCRIASPESGSDVLLFTNFRYQFQRGFSSFIQALQKNFEGTVSR